MVVGVVVAVVVTDVVVCGVVVTVEVNVVVVVGVVVGVVSSQFANSPSSYFSNAPFNRLLTALQDARVGPRIYFGLIKHRNSTAAADELAIGASGYVAASKAVAMASSVSSQSVSATRAEVPGCDGTAMQDTEVVKEGLHDDSMPFN